MPKFEGGGRIHRPDSVLHNMLVDLKKTKSDGSLVVVLSEPRPPYKEGDEFELGPTEFERMWDGTL